jgi:lysophospholipase L1-like esterase
MIVFEVGINDAKFLTNTNEFLVPRDAFRRNVTWLIQEAKKLSAEVVLVGGFPVADVKLDPVPWEIDSIYKTEFMRLYEDILASECTTQGVDYVDIYGEFEKGNLHELLSHDGLHPSTKGHELIYMTFLRWLESRGWL